MVVSTTENDACDRAEPLTTGEDHLLADRDEEELLQEKKRDNTDAVGTTPPSPHSLPLHETCEKQAKFTLYRKLIRYNIYPEYITSQLGTEDFYSICKIREIGDSYMGSGRGRSKKIAEQVAATEALNSGSYSKYAPKTEDDEDNDELYALIDSEGTGEEDAGIEGDDTEVTPENPKLVDNFEYFKPDNSTKVEVNRHINESAGILLNDRLREAGFTPVYRVVKISDGNFYSYCSVKNTAVVIGEGQGTSLHDAQQAAATAALEGDAIKTFLE